MVHIDERHSSYVKTSNVWQYFSNIYSQAKHVNRPKLPLFRPEPLSSDKGPRANEAMPRWLQNKAKAGQNTCTVSRKAITSYYLTPPAVI